MIPPGAISRLITLAFGNAIAYSKQENNSIEIFATAGIDDNDWPWKVLLWIPEILCYTTLSSEYNDLNMNEFHANAYAGNERVLFEAF